MRQHHPAADRANQPASGMMPEYPGKELPVASRPAVLTFGGDIVARWEFVDNFDVGGKAGAGDNALKQIVAEQGIFRNAAGESGFERIHVVDAFAGIGAFAKEILIYVGDRGRIRVDAARAGEDPLVKRALATHRQRRRDAGLENGIAVNDTLQRGGGARWVEGEGRGV